MTICDKIEAYFMNKEADHGRKHAIVSRVCKFSNIGTKDSAEKCRLYEVMHKQLKWNGVWKKKNA